MHIKNFGSFVYDVIVYRRDLKLGGPQLCHDRIYFVLQENQIPHNGGAGVGSAEGRPGAERKSRFDGHAGDSDVQVTPWECYPVDITSFLSGAAQRLVNLYSIERLSSCGNWY